MSRISVRRLLSFAFAAVGILPLLLFTVAFGFVLRSHLDEDIRDTTQAVLRAVSAQTSERVLAEPRRLLPSLLMVVENSSDRDFLRLTLRSALISRPEFLSIAFLDAEGGVEAVYPDGSLPEGRPYRLRANRTEGNVSFSEPFAADGASTRIIEVAFSNAGRTVVALIDLTMMSSKLILVALSPRDRLGVTDGSGRYLLSSDPSRVARAETAPAAAFSNEPKLIKEDDGEFFGSSIPIPGSDWHAVYFRSRAVADAPMREYMWRVVALAFTGLAISTAFAMTVWRSFSKPLAVLVSRIELIAAGRYAERVAGEFSTEFREIAESFNSMAESIERRDRAIQRSEARYRLLFNGNRAPALLVDAENGSIRDSNPAARAYYGYTEAEIKRLGIDDIDETETPPILICLREAANSVGGSVLSRHALKTGAIRDVELYVDRVEYEGKWYYHLIVFDVTQRRIAEERTVAALNDKTHLLQEVYHRVKNNQQLIVSLLRMQADSDDDPHAKAALKTAQERMYAMALAQEIVYQTDDLSAVNVADFADRLLSNLAFMNGVRRDIVSIDMDDIHLDLERAVPFALAFNEMIGSAVRLVPREAPAGSIRITGRLFDDECGLKTARISISDPFVAFSVDEEETLGDLLIRALAGQLSGRAEWKRAEAAGGRMIELTFHLAKENRTETRTSIQTGEIPGSES